MGKVSMPQSIEALAQELVTAVYSMLADGVAFMVWGHSIGAWVAFEFVILCRRLGLNMPMAAFFMAFPAPHMPVRIRRWRKTVKMNEEQLKDQVVRWDAMH